MSDRIRGTQGCEVPEVKTPQNLARFEGFELDLRAGELRQEGGKTLRLPEQPFQILVTLLAHAGEVVTREELRKKLWPNDTIVEFEHSISAAMNRLRQALGDSADSPRYIETLARRGYRWKVPMEWVERSPAQEAPVVVALPQRKPVGESLIGKLVSHYRVLEVLGGGGMGIVYQAEDIKLGRRVALKFLPEELGSEPVMRERFEREARATSSLDHPNICAIYEVEEHEGRPFIVMQLLEGQTLRERINSGTRLTSDEVIDIALQIVEGLDAAHKKGIIHRDIKPANIFLTRRAEAKILDFGLAKLESGNRLPSEIEQPEGCSTSIPDRPTVSYAADLNLTKAGERVGTACYMSPEQVRGERLDARTDLFSLGLLVYEMATAHQAFPGDTASVVHNAILYSTPQPPQDLNPELPTKLTDILTKCLEKNRESRYQSAADLRRDLKALKQDFESSRFVASTVATTAASGRRWQKIGFALLLAVGVALVAGWFFIASRIGSKSTLPPLKVRPLLTNLGIEGRPAFSPDGGQIAFMWNGGQGDQFDIYVKLIDDAAAPVRVTKSPGAFAAWPVWSPDGHRLAFFRCSDASNGIYVVPVLGGRERRIAELRSCPDSLDWSPDGRLLAFADQDSTDQPQSIFLVSLETGERRRLTIPTRLEQDSVPNFSRDGKTIAFVRSHGIIVQDIFLVPVDGGQPRRLTFMNGLFSGLTWTPGDKEVIFSNQVGNNNFLWRIKASGGAPERVTEVGAANASEPVITRQGNRLAYRQVSSNMNIWQIRLPTSKGRASAPVKLISSTRSQDGQQYSPDGKKIVFVSDRSGSSQIWICDSDGSNAVQITSTDAPNNGTPRWSPDGRSIVFDSIADNLGVYLVPADGGTPRALVVDSHFNAAASFSRDGRWVYFVSDRSGEYQVWKVPSGGGQSVQVTFHGGWHPMESTDGKFLYYLKTPVPTDPSNTAASLWRMPLVGGEEHMVIPEKIYLHWTVGPQGIFFIDQGCQASACPTPATKPRPSLNFFDIATGRTAKLATLEKQPSCCNQSLTVSPDGRSILYGQEDSVTTDIMLVENFR
jgi:eukaryotic-like serine/threonine-protein kinase